MTILNHLQVQEKRSAETVSGLYHDRSAAERSVNALQAAGFAREQIDSTRDRIVVVRAGHRALEALEILSRNPYKLLGMA